MGGMKKKPVGSSEKGVSSGPAGEEKKADTKKGSAKQVQKQKLTVLIDEGQAMKSIRTLKPITSQALARTNGVKISVANAFLRSLETKGVVKPIGGYSGHRLYELVNV
jgi:small subunit ribosomal protein S25e